MKKCAYCGLQNEDVQDACSRCGTPFGSTPLTDEQSATVVMGIGFVFQLLARYILDSSVPGTRSAFLGMAMLIVGIAGMLWGCTWYASAKGYSRYLGLLGLLSCVGGIVLYCLPKRPIETDAVKEVVKDTERD